MRYSVARMIPAMIFATILLAAATQAQTAPPPDPSDTYLPVCISGKWGYIDANGEMMIRCRFDMARRFFDGRAAVRQGTSWSYINTDGSFAFEGGFHQARDFRQGFAAVKDAGVEDGKSWYFIDRSGAAIADEQRWSEVSDFSDGFAALVTGLGVGYLNGKGEVELSFGLSGRLPSDFYQGLSAYSFPMIGSSVRSTTGLKG